MSQQVCTKRCCQKAWTIYFAFTNRCTKTSTLNFEGGPRVYPEIFFRKSREIGRSSKWQKYLRTRMFLRHPDFRNKEFWQWPAAFIDPIIFVVASAMIVSVVNHCGRNKHNAEDETSGFTRNFQNRSSAQILKYETCEQICSAINPICKTNTSFFS